ncbi:DEAD/DEAH box helicase [Mycolicibacterium psychrotolerans]|uniref:DEAD/DEAH box helicase n=1 Tax=Mycolicibacterium psychrotolerans TaxID=216929 RepID=UPI0013D3D21D|nr:DEAD/DEAH box helicase [Mycolicibacterium psychrotolerans]
MGTFSDLRGKFDPDDDRRRGKQFEYVCKWFLENDPTYQPLLRRVWLWDDWPGRKGIDAGIDLVAEDIDGKLWAIQAKAYAPSHSISKRDVDKFIAESSRSKFTHRLLIATTDKRHHIATRLMDDLGIPFIGLTQLLDADDYLDWPSTPAALRPSKPPNPKTPREYQKTAINDVVKGFTTADRGQMIMACGTGKTLTAWFITEKLAAERTLVLVPSLSLLKQTMREWQTANPKKPFATLPVCSDETVGSLGEDAAVSHTSDLGVPVTTDPEMIAEFLRKRSGPRVVFSTYQSSPQIAAAFNVGRVPQFDLVIADEAHRVAGKVSSDFGTVLDASAIRGKRRLFMTATPRYFTGRILSAATGADYEIASMDDPIRFGEVFHRLSFAEAIRRNLLTDYQVAVIGVDDATYLDWAERGTLVTLDGKRITDARSLAGQIGLGKAMRKFNLRRTISFHGRVKTARDFASSMPTVLAWMPPRQRPKGWLWSAYASGEMSAGERAVLIQHLKRLDDGERGLLANARCLAEGVDVPALDGVAFIDPRRSEVDIVQAVGRAIRKSDNKKVGTVVIPVFIDADADPEVALDSSVFKPVWDVIKALRAHDTELGEELDVLRREMGRKGGKPRLPNKIYIDVPATVDKSFANALEARLVEQTTNPWEFWCGLLEQFTKEHGHARVPRGYSSASYKLDNWVTNQRAFRRRGVLSEERQRRLEQLPGWVWDPHDGQWEKKFISLQEFLASNGHARVPRSNDQLGAWVQAQRQKFAKGTLESDRQRRLESLAGWTWDPHDFKWESGFALLVDYVRVHGNSRVPRSFSVAGFNLGAWVSTQRQKFDKGSLADDRRRRLEAIAGWSWDPFLEQWEGGFAHLADYVRVHGNARVPSGGSFQGFELGQWVSRQRAAQSKGELSTDRIARLESLSGWAWNEIAARWEEGFNHLLAYVAERGTSRVPFGYRSPDGMRLGQWINMQRNAYAAGTLADDRRERLEHLTGWTWNARLQLWEDGYAALCRYVQQTGSASVPYDGVFEGFTLGKWVTTQRRAYTAGKLSKERQERLLRLPGWVWDAIDEQWEAGFIHLLKWVESTGSSAKLPRNYLDATDGYGLGNWVAVQRQFFKRGKLDPARRKRLESVPDWSWDPKSDAWDLKFDVLAQYVAKHGDSRVPPDCDFQGVRLDMWCRSQRAACARGSLSESRRRRLDELPGWVWDAFDAQWESAFESLLAFVEREGTSLVPQSHREDGFSLGGWVTQQRSQRAKGELRAERQGRLEELPGWSWDPKVDYWEAAFARLCTYQREHGTPAVPRGLIYEGFKLGDWVERQRSAYSKAKLDADRVHRLEAVSGWRWSPKEEQWDRGFAALLDYVAEHGDALVPAAYVVDGFRLGGWVNTQRLAHFEGTMTPSRRERLENVSGWSWDARAENWERAFGLVEDYVREHGNARVPHSHRVKGIALGAWVVTQRMQRKKGTLPAKRQQRLSSLPGWIWDYAQGQWDDALAALKHYVDAHGTTSVPQGFTFDGIPLGNWVVRQRREYAKGTLDPDRQRTLEQLPTWSWDPYGDEWDRRFDLLKHYVAEHGDARVPAPYKTTGGLPLGSWVRDQRDNYRKGTLKADRARKLMTLPHWTWDAPPKGPRRGRAVG